MLIVTIIFFIVTTLTFYFYVNKINNSYQALVKKELSNLQNLQRITIISNRNYFLLFQLFQAKDSNTDSIKSVWYESLKINSQNFDKLSDSLGIFSKKDPNYKKLIDARMEYRKNVDHFFDYINDEDLKTSFFVLTVNKSFSNYQEQLNDFTSDYKTRLINHSNEMSSKVVVSSLSFVLLGFSPLIFTIILTIGYLVFMAGLVIYIFFFGTKLE